MPFSLPKLDAVIRAVRLSHRREIAAARVAALEESNELLQTQAIQLERQGKAAREMAEELALTNEELRSVVLEVEKARAAADGANRSKSEFLAVMSHELRTPLASIGGYVDLLEMGVRGPINEPQRADLQRIRRSQQHLLGIINDILSFTRLDATEIQLEMIEVPVRPLLQELEAVVGSLARAKSLSYACRPPAAKVFVRTDPDKLRQILINLVSNSVKFTMPGGAIRVFSETRDETLAISVADTGLGIPPEKLDAVFEPFVQLDHALTRTTEGTGLGLAISRGLARAMGGELTVSSEVAVGSVFTITVPLAGDGKRNTPAGG